MTMTFGEHIADKGRSSAAAGRSSCCSAGFSLCGSRSTLGARASRVRPLPVHPAQPHPLHPGRAAGAGDHDEQNRQAERTAAGEAGLRDQSDGGIEIRDLHDKLDGLRYKAVARAVAPATAPTGAARAPGPRSCHTPREKTAEPAPYQAPEL